MSNNQVVKLEAINGVIAQEKQTFEELAKIHGAVNWKAEASFALQAFQNAKGDFLYDTAQKNPNSLRNAVVNIAAIGLSLNPALNHAYLVPRDGKICLDISYMGLIHLACETGSIIWAQAETVRKNDEFTFRGVGEKPTHKMDPFGERGEVTGFYCVAKTTDNEYLTTIMSDSEVKEIRNRTAAYKAFVNKKIKSTPWESDYCEMGKKTCIKRAAKTWPKIERLHKAIEADNVDNGFDFEIPATEVVQENKIKDLEELINKVPWENHLVEERLLKHLKDKFIKDFKSVGDLEPNEIEYSINFLSQFTGGAA